MGDALERAWGDLQEFMGPCNILVFVLGEMQSNQRGLSKE